MTQTTINVEALRALLECGRPIIVLDIRRADERAEWAIPGSVHVDAYDALKAGDPDALADVDLPADRPIITVCGAGKTSAIAAQQLRARGFQALSLVGGMKAWSLAWNYAEVALPGSAAQVVQVRRTGKGCLSYLVGSASAAAVIDAALDPQVYLGLANQYGWRITIVLDTHIHADHLSRSRALAEHSGAHLYLPDQDRVGYPFKALRDGDSLPIGKARLVAIHTPGHTPESMCYLLDDRALFTGDTLFLAGVGRPDLEAGAAEARTRASTLYRSLQRLLALPAATLVLPGHTNAPVAFDQHPIGASLAQVRAQVAALHLPQDAFVDQVLARIPLPPPNHQRIVELNQAGRLPTGDPTDLEAGANRCAVV
jgi:glyoxylase-like metal-dependent hydrolase (beta-lactamase superfamily II)